MTQLTQQEFLTIVENFTVQQRLDLANKLVELAPEPNTDARSAKLVACVTTVDKQYPNLDELRNHLKGKLPDYFLPQTFIPVTELPRTPLGKIDRKGIQNHQWSRLDDTHYDEQFSPDDENFFSSSMDYAAPSSDYEKLLAGIWCEVLGIEDISVHDNFIEVGGDSLLSIRILSRINKAGLSIAPEDFFEFPTISQQAMCLENTQANSVEQGVAEGTFEMIPIQHWFFERINNAPEQWNQNCLLSTKQSLDYISLERTIQKIMLQHDALRSVFSNVDGIIKQRIRPFDGNIPLKSIDLSELNESELSTRIVREAEYANRSFELDKGPLIQFLFVQTSAHNDNKLLITLHHLLVDAQSWHILLDDLSNCWKAMSSDVDFKLSPKSTSLKLWSEKLQQYADSTELKAELDYWRQQSNCQFKSLPLDFSNPPEQNIEQTTELVELHSDLSIETLTTFCQINNTDVQAVLIAALVKTLANYADTEAVLIDVEGHGRETLFEKIDVSRTVGWFTTVYPLAFKDIAQPLDALFFQSIKSTLRSIPNKGIGYGVLRELAKDTELNNSQLAEVCLNYLGRVNDVIGENSQSAILARDAINVGQPRSAKASRAFVFEINCAVIDDKLSIKWSYSNKLHRQETVEYLAKNQIANIGNLVKLGIITDSANDKEEYFDLAGLDDSDLDTISDLLDDLDDD